MKEVNLFFVMTVFAIAAVCGGASSCSRNKEDYFKAVDADVWLHDLIPPETCAAVSGLKDLGIYRQVKCTDVARKSGYCSPTDETYEEFVSYCDKSIKDRIAMHRNDFKKWIDVARQKIDECF